MAYTLVYVNFFLYLCSEFMRAHENNNDYRACGGSNFAA